MIKNLFEDWLNSTPHVMTRRLELKTIGDDDWMVYLTLTTASLTEQRKSVSSPLIGDFFIPQKKLQCCHGANSCQIKDLLMENVSFVRVITA